MIPKNPFLHAVNSGDSTLLAPLLAESPLPAADALTIYKTNREEALTRALGTSFSVTLQLVGAEFFAVLSLRYQQHHLPEKANLDHYGASFPAFLERQPELEELSYLPDIARLEWTIQQSRLAGHAERLRPQALGAFEPEALLSATLTLHPATRLFDSAYPVEAIWRWHQLAETERGELNLDELPPSRLVLVRVPDKGIALEALAEGQFSFLSALAEGKTLLEASETALFLNPRFNLAEEMLFFLNAGCFATIEAKARF